LHDLHTGNGYDHVPSSQNNGYETLPTSAAPSPYARLEPALDGDYVDLAVLPPHAGQAFAYKPLELTESDAL
jgi:hypothetical protein